MDDLEYVKSTINPWLDKFIEKGPTSLTPHEAIAVGIWMLQAKVNNGGFDLYYYSQAGALALPTVAALTEIGANETASILRAANAEFPDSQPPQDQTERQQHLDAINEVGRFKALETEFYSEPDDLVALLATYLKSNSNTY